MRVRRYTLNWCLSHSSPPAHPTPSTHTSRGWGWTPPTPTVGAGPPPGDCRPPLTASTWNAEEGIYGQLNRFMPQKNNLWIPKFEYNEAMNSMREVFAFKNSSRTTILQDMQTRFSVQFLNSYLKQREIFNTVPVSWIQHSLRNFPLF